MIGGTAHAPVEKKPLTEFLLKFCAPQSHLESMHSECGSPGRYCINFGKIAVVVLNQKVRPFTTKWHSRVEAGPLSAEQSQEFRSDLLALQNDLRSYTHLLADMAEVEDITDLEAAD